MITKTNGAAGHGKTHELINQVKKLELQGKSFVLVSPTNKAKTVINNRLTQSGLSTVAQTIDAAIYTYEKGDVIGVTVTKVIDHSTGKFKRDESGEIVTTSTTEYEWTKVVRSDIPSIIVVDESSMVQPQHWYDMVNSDLVEEIHTYGDERQLPPVISNSNKFFSENPHLKPYDGFWANLPATTTLLTNHRQSGHLKTFVQVITENIFDSTPYIPSDLKYGDNYTLHSNMLSPELVISELSKYDMVLSPFKINCDLINNIIRSSKHVGGPQVYFKSKRALDPVIGDKIIFTANKYSQTSSGKRQIEISKGTFATIIAVMEVDQNNNIASIMVRDEFGSEFLTPVCLACFYGGRTDSTVAQYKYAYCITVHSSQGGQWGNVLFMDSNSSFVDNRTKYTAITRASSSCAVWLGVTHAVQNDKNYSKNLLVQAINSLK